MSIANPDVQLFQVRYSKSRSITLTPEEHEDFWKMTYLEALGASLYYEIKGQGPMLLCISGADGSCEIWRGMAEYLKDKFTVVMWDRM